MSDEVSAATLALWAKTGDEQSWLSLHQHMLDSADVAGCLYDSWLPRSTRGFLGQAMGLEDEEVRALVSWVAGVHDVGKASKPFQFQLDHSPEHRRLSDSVREAGFPSAHFSPSGIEVENLAHSVYSQAIQQWWLQEECGWRQLSAIQLAGVGGAHHGLPPTSPQRAALQRTLVHTHAEPWQEAWRELLQAITAHTQAEQFLVEHPRLKVPVNAQMVLAGIVIMSDWIASNAELFPLAGPGNPLGATGPGERVNAAMSQLHLPARWRPEPCGEDLTAFYRQRFDWPEHFAPNTLQVTAAEIAKKVSEPGLFIIEAPMGLGKTEAGLILTDIVADRLDIGGLMFGTPTTATSDGLFGRTATWAGNTQNGQRIASMFLAHSRNALNEDFMDIRRSSYYTQAEQESAHSQVISHEWQYGRKKGILSDIVIGTVDQVLQMALQTKHVMLRHLSFAGKIVIIDEIHAYDSYMQVYMQRAVEWLASYGVTVILLSATLPHTVRESLASAYQRGSGGRPTASAANDQPDLSYPLITQVDAQRVEKHVLPNDAAPKDIALREIDDSLETVSGKLEALRIDGGCAVVICNTVQRAQAVYGHLKPLFGDDISLLHARFTSIDRKNAEGRLLQMFGPSVGRTAGRPGRHVLVATQIVEQSLDLDFDLMITDFCPVDLLLQRAGRLHRHQRSSDDRPNWALTPTVYVRGIEASGTESAPPDFVRASRTIYEEAILLSSYALLLPKLREREPLAIPQHISPLVQHAYQTNPSIPEPWGERYEQAADRLRQHIDKKRAEAGAFLLGDHRKQKTLSDAMPFREASVKEHLAELKASAQVRDIEPTLEVLLVQRDANESYRLLPGQTDEDLPFYAHQTPDERTARQIALNSVRLPYHYSLPRNFDPALDELEQRYFFDAWQQSPYLRGQLILPLDDNYEAELAGRILRYSHELGLQLLHNTTDASEETAWV